MPTPRIAYLDGPRLRRTLVAACDHAQRQRSELNRINVFPVPDGDTGTNLALTVRAIADHLRGNQDRSVSGVAAAAADAAVLGARGNCGMMLSHFLLGFSQALEERDEVTADEFSVAMRSGVDNLYRSLEKPVEGTILTVMREAAEEAESAQEPDFEPLLNRVVVRARDALARTPDFLPALKAAGVVDAGAKGFVSLLEGALLLVAGDPLVALPVEAEPVVDGAARAEMTEKYRYCTEGMVRGPGLPTQEAVRDRLRDRGDSMIVIRAGEVLKIHIHTDEPEDVFGYLRTLGELVTHKAEDMRAQHSAVERAAGSHVQLARRPVTVIADSACDLPEEIVRAHGIQITPCVLIDGDRVLKDGVDLSAVEFHDRLIAAKKGKLPTTSQPAPADFLETFERAAEDGEAIVGVILGSGLSGTFGSAQAAANRFRGAPVHLVDSKGASLLAGLLALKACELGELGTKPADIVVELDRVRAQSGVLFTVDVFDRLVASGRVGRGRALVGNALHVKPILELSAEGKVQPVGKVIGRKRLVPAVMAELEKRVPRTVRKLRFAVMHVAAPHIVAEMTEAVRGRWGRSVEVLSGPMTPVLSTHLGPGAWGVAYLVED